VENSAETFGFLASPSARSYNMRVSGYGASHLRPNPSLSLMTSDTRQPISKIRAAYGGRSARSFCLSGKEMKETKNEVAW